MSKEMTVVVLGVWIVVLPYLGIPDSWRTVLFILTGIALMILGFLLRGEALSRGGKSSSRQSYVENTASITQDYSAHDHKEGISSLN